MSEAQEIVSHKLPSSAVIPTIIVVFISIALHNVLELYIKTFGTFKRYAGLYFWSVLVATTGIAFNSVGYLLQHLELTPWPVLHATLILIGWCTMITGQSVVMYSRIHIVMQDRRQLYAVLIMIIVNAIWLHVPVIVLVYGMNSSAPQPFLKPYLIYEKIQLTVFVIQESIISGLYVWKTSKMLQLEKAIRNVRTRRVLSHLVYVNVVVILLDISVLSLEYANQTTIQTAWKPFVYSVKLKLEFSILNRLVDLVKPQSDGGTHSRSGADNARRKGVALVTFEDERRRRQSKPDQEFDSKRGYSVHIGVGKSQHSERFDDCTVLKTTEIEVHQHERRDDLDDDTVSLAGKPGSMESNPETQPHRACASSASSEIEFARSRA